MINDRHSTTPSGCEYFWDDHVPRILEVGRDTTIPTLTCAIAFHLQGEGGGDWTVSVRDGLVERIARGRAADATALVALPASTFLDIARGRVDHKIAFFKGQIDITGDVALVLRLAGMIPILRARFPFQEPSCSEVRS